MRLTQIAPIIRRYFYSGWAFLIPYLAVYLLYYVTKWPVNAIADATAGQGLEAIGNGSITHPLSPVPCLLHVYWVLHIAHVILAGFALWSWWKHFRAKGQIPNTKFQENAVEPSTLSAQTANLRSLIPILILLAPWGLLTLLFYIPGVYLEYPADPWQHYARINEWSWLNTVNTHSYWTKSSYFLAYSLVDPSPHPRQLSYLNLYYTTCCLLLCWQYYKLARSLGLSERAAMFFVILQTLLFGNNIFGFYRYYGIASTILAQIGAVALSRLGMQTITPKTGSPQNGTLSYAISTEATNNYANLKHFFAGLCLLLLIALNHLQCLGIAGLTLTALLIWRLVVWKKTMVVWLALAIITTSVIAVFYFPRHPLLESSYRPGGWFTPWYGFNVFSLSSGAGDRTRWILGLFGLFNIIAGLALLLRNHVVGWVTITPLLALCLPVVAIPLANILAPHYLSGDGIITFTRMLFAIPAGMGLVALGEQYMECNKDKKPIVHNENMKVVMIEEQKAISTKAALTYSQDTTSPIRINILKFPLCLVALAVILLVPTNSPYYNHFWNTVVVSPKDLTMDHVIEASGMLSNDDQSDAKSGYGKYSPPFVKCTGILTTPGIGYVVQATGKAWIPDADKQMSKPPATTTDLVLANLKHIGPTQVHSLQLPASRVLYTQSSQAGLMSTHWLADAVALAHSTQKELFSLSTKASTVARRTPELWLDWASGQAHANMGRMALKETVKGKINKDHLILRPVLKAFDGNGWRVSVGITGPNGFYRFFEDRRRPLPLGGLLLIFSDFEIPLPPPGIYTIELSGTTAWPTQTEIAHYSLIITSAQN